MFFSNPVAAMRSMLTALRSGATMTHIVWRTPDDNPWLSMAKEVALGFLSPPGDDARTCGPGPFSMANQEMATGMMKSAGYENIEFERVDAPILVGHSVQDAIDFQLAIGPAGEVFREAGGQAEENAKRSRPPWPSPSAARRRKPTASLWTHRPG